MARRSKCTWFVDVTYTVYMLRISESKNLLGGPQQNLDRRSFQVGIDVSFPANIFKLHQMLNLAEDL